MTEEQQQKFLRLLQQHRVSLERFTLNMTRNRAAARELMSETIAIACESFAQVRDEQAFLSYLFTIATRRQRARKRTDEKETAMSGDEIDELYAGGLKPDECMSISELREAIDSLSEEYREPLVLAELVGLPHKEIEVILGLSASTVRVRIHRAKQQLRILLGDAQTVTENE